MFKFGWFPPFQDRQLFFPKLRNFGFGLRGSSFSKPKPLVTLTRVHVFNFCQFQVEQLLEVAATQKIKVSDFLQPVPSLLSQKPSVNWTTLNIAELVQTLVR
jgi:hypothetical protein